MLYIISCFIFVVNFTIIPFSHTCGMFSLTHPALVFVLYWASSIIAVYGLFEYGRERSNTYNRLLNNFSVNVGLTTMVLFFVGQVIVSSLLSFNEPFWFYQLIGELFSDLNIPKIFYFMILLGGTTTTALCVIEYGDKYQDDLNNEIILENNEMYNI